MLGRPSSGILADSGVAGRYLPEYHEAKGTRDFFACCRDPEVASTITLQPIERFAGLIDAAIIFSDILVIPQAMGMTVEIMDKKGPHFPNPLKTPDDGQYAEVMNRDVDVAKEKIMAASMSPAKRSMGWRVRVEATSGSRQQAKKSRVPLAWWYSGR